MLKMKYPFYYFTFIILNFIKHKVTAIVCFELFHIQLYVAKFLGKITVCIANTSY